MHVILLWSYHRIRHQVVSWFRFTRLVLDWTVLVYLIFPSVVIGIFESRRYYDGAVLANLSPRTVIVGPISLSALAAIITALLVTGIHFSTFGKLAFPMQHGDRAFVLMAPLKRTSLFVAVWCETTFSMAVNLAVLTVLVFPLLKVLEVTLSAWLVRMTLLSIYVTSSRIMGVLIRQNDNVRLKDWAVFQSLRIVLCVPLLMGIPRMFYAATRGMPWLLVVATLVAIAAVWWMQQRFSWDPFYRDTPSRVKDMFLLPGIAQTLPSYSMKNPSSLLVRLIEQASLRFRSQPIHPVVWLFLLRVLRKRGVLWDYVRISVGGVVALQLVHVQWVRFLAAAFFLFLFREYWKSNIAVLYQVPAREQFVASSFAIEIIGRQIMMTAVVITACCWLLAGLL